MARKKPSPPQDALPEVVSEDEDLTQTLDLAAETLTGDLRDFILDRVRYEQDKRPWDERSESDQRFTIAQVETAVHAAVVKAVEIIGAGGRRTIKATLEQVTVKDAIVGKIVLSKHDEQRHALMDATGARILIVVADPDDFTGERAPPEIKPDQGDLIATSGVVHSDPDGARGSSAAMAAQRTIPSVKSDGSADAEVPFH